MSDQTEFTMEDVEAALNGTTEEPNAEEESAPAAETPEDHEPEAEAPANDDSEEDPEPEDDWALKARQIQAAKDREVAEARREAQKLREELAEMRGRQSAREEMQSSSQQNEVASVSANDLREGMEANLPHTFQWTVQNRPDLVPALITMVRQSETYGDATADQMVVEYAEYKSMLAEHKQQQLIEELRAEREAEQAPLRSQEAMEEVVESLTERFGETFEAMRDEIADRLNTDGREYVEYLQHEAMKAGEDPADVVTPELIRDMMVDIYLDLREQAMNQQSSEPDKPQPVGAAGGALGSNASQPAPADEEQDFLNSFIDGARKADFEVDPKFLP